MKKVDYRKAPVRFRVVGGRQENAVLGLFTQSGGRKVPKFYP
jgi:hypothetical protein